MKKQYCEWKYDEDDDFYETSCDHGFYFGEGDVKENNIKFCPYCGKIIKELIKE